MPAVTKKRYPFQKRRRWQFVKILDFLFDRFQKSNSAKPFPKTVEKILIVRLDHIGDSICTTPVLPVLKQHFPNVKITVLTGSEGQAVFQRNPFVYEIIIFGSNWFSRSKMLNLFELFRILSQLRKAKFDLGYDLRGDIRNILLMVSGSVKFRVGYGIAGGAGLLHRVGEYDERLHQVELNMKLVTGEVSGQRNLIPKIYLSDPEKEEAKSILNQTGVRETDEVIAVHPEAGYPSKEWEEKKFKELIEWLIHDKQNKVVILGLTKAKKIAEHFSSPHLNPLHQGEGKVREQNQVIDLVGKLSLRQMIAVMSQCDAFIGNDSGPSHIAQALKIPALVVASGTNEYDRWGIWNQPSIVLSNPVSCAPCHLQECNVEGHPCMAQISSEQVFQALKQLAAV